MFQARGKKVCVSEEEIMYIENDMGGAGLIIFVPCDLRLTFCKPDWADRGWSVVPG